ncbi:ubiquitin-protein transferase [Aureococcus anophagefferens]|nr:ubiquitin-protein transferase [Aureococcus anophagefferens]
MNLGDLWGWEKRKLGCRIRAETQNPALDEIRERLSKMSGRRPQTTGAGKALRTGRVRDELSRPTTAALGDGAAGGLTASSTAALVAYQRDALPKEISKTRKNINKKFFQIPRSPPAKIMLDLQKDRLRLPPPTAGGDAPPREPEGEAPPVAVGAMRPKTTGGAGGRSGTNRRGLPDKARSASPESPEKGKEVEGDARVVDKDHVFPPYHGDLFMTRGVYMGGIIYQSRLQDHAEGGRRRKGPGEDAERDREEAAKLLAAKLKAEEEERLRLSVPAKRDDPKAHEAKLHCANSLASWSTHAENAARLAEEGAVSAALVLSKDENADVRRACATAFKNMSQHAELCAQLVKHTAVPVISDLGVAAKDIAVSRDCGLALVNLTIMDGIEAKLVEDGVVIALMSLMNQHEELAELCSRGLFNLTCVDQPYMYMERVIKAFVSLASSTMAAVKHVCAAALCNLSDIKAVRSRIVEEGVVQVVGLLARGAEARTRRVCAIVLHSLASTRTCRADMVSKGAVQVLYALSSDVDTITLHYIASAIIRLAMEDQNLPRLVHEGGVTALCNICPVPARRVDDAALRVLGQGGVASVIALCSHASSEIREACAPRSSTSAGRGARRVSALAIPAIIALSRLPEPRTRMRCAATLCKLASVEANVGLMVERRRARFIDMLQTRDQEIVKHCCAALCRLAHEGSSAVTIAEGAVPHVIAGPAGGPCAMGTLGALVALARDRAGGRHDALRAVAFANLSHEPTVQGEMVAAGIVPVVAELSNSYCEENQLYCARALCNLGCHAGSEEAIVKQGGVAALMMICMVRAVSHLTKQVCAKALLNLLCTPAVRENWLPALAKEGLVQACSVLSRLSEEETMRVCASIFCTLSAQGPAGRAPWSSGGRRSARRARGRRVRADEPVHAGDPEAEVAADAYFLIAGDEACRLEMVEAKVLPVLITNARSPNGPTRQSCLRTCGAAAALEAEPAGDADAAAPAAAPADEKPRGDDVVQDLTLYIFTYMTFASEDHRVAMVRDDVVPALELLYRRLTLGGPPERARRVRLFVAAALRSLAAATAALDKLVEDGAVRLLCDMMCAEDDASNAEVFEHCARALYSVPREQRFNGVLLDQGALEAIPRLGALPECCALAAATLHLLSLEPPHREMIAREELASAGLVPLLIRLSRHGDDKVASSCSEALKNLSSGGSGGIEEGTVSTLIAMTLSGGPSTNAAALDADSLAELPQKPRRAALQAVAGARAPEPFRRLRAHTVSVMKMVGGIAGAGPAARAAGDGRPGHAGLSFLDSGDALEDDENMGASMMFAKITADAFSSA